MALKAILTTLDQLSDDLKKLYKKRDDGKFTLDVEGLVEREKLRTTHRAPERASIMYKTKRLVSDAQPANASCGRRARSGSGI
jgi:hypothetical protein